MNWNRYILSRLFIAVPELGTNKSFARGLVDAGVINEAQYRIFRRIALQKTGVKSLTGRPLLERLIATVPELLSVRFFDVIAQYGLFTDQQARVLRIGLRVAGRLLPMNLGEATIYERMAMVFDDIFSPETVNFIRALDNEQIQALADILRAFPQGYGLREEIFGHRFGTLTSGDAALIRAMLERSIRRAQILRSVISTGRIVRNTVAEAAKLDKTWDVLGLIFDDLFSEKILKNLVRAGVMSAERYEVWRAAQQLGAGVWKKIGTAAEYDSWAARGLLLSEGVISPETIKMLQVLGIISPRQAQMLYPVAQIIRGITRTIGGNWRKAHRYRIVPGEAPIKTFARYSQQTDRAILKLLAEAAEDARKEAEWLASTKEFGRLARAAQQRLVTRELHKSMGDVWDQVGHLIIFGEKEAAAAALDAMTFLERPYGASGADLQRSLRATAQAGVDSYVSREESLRPLSRRVYNNLALARRQVDREIAKGLLRGLSPAELAAQVERYIKPSVPGGMSYAAMRLARTEINNAFHQTSIRYTREMPWVDGYRWNLSGSHPRTDVCNDMSERNHDGIGRGVYAKDDVPGKPHPQCLCYVTTVTDDTGTFYKRYRSGAYDRYINSVTNTGVFEETDDFTPTRFSTIAAPLAKTAVVAALGAVTNEFKNLFASR